MEKVSFESHRNFIKRLGESDAVVEFTEVAVRAFVAQAQESGDFKNFLSTQSAQHSIRVNDVTLTTYREKICRGYLIMVAQNFEQFLGELKQDYLLLFKESWRQRKEGETLLDNTLLSLNVKPNAQLLALFKYYSFIRNSHAHGDIKDANQELKKVYEYKESIIGKYRLDAPNHFDKIKFDDFILFTRAVKDLSDEITNPIYTKIIEQDLVVKYLNTTDSFKSVRKLAEPRRSIALQNAVKTKFGLSNDYSNKIIKLRTSLA